MNTLLSIHCLCQLLSPHHHVFVCSEVFCKYLRHYYSVFLPNVQQLSSLSRSTLSAGLRTHGFRRFLSQDARAKIQAAVKETPIVLFMKGTPEMPQCGFSRAAIQVLDIHQVPPEKLTTYNVLEDAELRSGIKEFS